MSTYRTDVSGPGFYWLVDRMGSAAVVELVQGEMGAWMVRYAGREDEDRLDEIDAELVGPLLPPLT